jgi:hypothetical protein
MDKRFTRYLIGASVLVACASASADCANALTAYASANSPLTGNGSKSYILANHPECFGGGSTTSQVQINSTSFQQVAAISSALSARFMASGDLPQANLQTKGMAAGGKSATWSTWGSINSNDTRQNYVATLGSGLTTANTNKILTTVLGADYALSPVLAVGVSAAFDSGDGTGSNGNTANSITSKGYAFAPYVGMQLSPALAVDASLGFGKGELNTTGVKSEADRWFAAANLSYNQWFDKVQLTGKLGYLHGEEDYGNSTVAGVSQSGTAARNKLDQLRLGVQAGYWMNDFMPYAGLAYNSDMSRSTTQAGATSDPIGKDAWVWTLGVNFFSLKNGVTGGIAYSQEEGRTNQKNNSLLANINMRF